MCLDAARSVLMAHGELSDGKHPINESRRGEKTTQHRARTARSTTVTGMMKLIFNICRESDKGGEEGVEGARGLKKKERNKEIFARPCRFKTLAN